MTTTSVTGRRSRRTASGGQPRSVTRSAAVRTEVLVIGTGFSGLGMAVELKRQGIEDFVILEKGATVGGTWRDNTYPGAACDVPTHLYSYSFEPKSDWSNLFSYQPEILTYLERVAEKYGLARHIRFHCTFTGAHWDDAEGLWHSFTADGTEFVSQFLVSGIGALHVPSIPTIAGSERFEGVTFHSAEWNHGYDLTGKRVAVIGTGASAVQFIPRIIDKVGSLQVYQRTAPWVLSRSNVEFPARLQRAFARIPTLRRLLRGALYWSAESGALAMTRYPGMLRYIERLGRRHIEREIADPELRRKVTPTYRAGCKRLLGSDTYYAALANSRTEVITDPIREVTATGIVTAHGAEHPADVIIYGTGFRVMDVFTTLDWIGRGGIDIAARWREQGVQAHLGITIPDAPNAFLLLGPNTGLGHNSVVFMIEAQIHYVSEAIRFVRHHGVQAIAPRQDAHDEFNRRTQEELSRSVWNSGGCSSWYLDEHGRNTTLWSGFTWEYWLRTRRLTADHYELITTDRPEVRRIAASNGKPARATRTRARKTELTNQP